MDRKKVIEELANCESFSNELKSAISLTLNTFNEAFEQFELQNLFLSFNGGKDCTILLHMLTDYIRKIDKNPKDLKVFHMRPKESFDEIEEFVESCKTYYEANIQVIEGPIRQVLQEITDNHPELKAVFMGNRRTDPWCDSLTVFKKTDHGWPDLMRINPILHWTHANVWEYLLKKKVPYCILYDRGYTSVGDKSNTIPNPHLKIKNPDGTESYLPAYELKDSDHLERAGRK